MSLEAMKALALQMADMVDSDAGTSPNTSTLLASIATLTSERDAAVTAQHAAEVALAGEVARGQLLDTKLGDIAAMQDADMAADLLEKAQRDAAAAADAARQQAIKDRLSAQ